MLNKNYDLLGEQLAESGLEMTITAAGAGLLIGMGTSVFEGIMGSNQAKDANDQADRNYRMNKLQSELDASVQNAQNKTSFGIQQLNYQTNRKFEYANSLRQWQYNESIQEFQHLQAYKQYGKSIENTADQLTYNNIAQEEARMGEQAALNEVYDEFAFQRQGALVDQLQAEGKTSLGQAGNSRNKAMQSTIASLGRNAAIMDASLSSSVEQTQRNLRQIAFSKYAADLQANASMMIEPERGPSTMRPMATPETQFMSPVPVAPAAVQRPTYQNTTAPLVTGFTGAAKQALAFDWKKF